MMPHLHRHGATDGSSQASTSIGMLVTWPRRYDLLVTVALVGRGRLVQRRIADALHLRSGDNVLDVGCGTGTLTLGLAQRVAPTGAAVGVDASPEMIEAARSKPTPAGAAVRFDVAPAQELPYREGQFDAVVTSLMIHHLPPDDRVPALREMRRVTRPGGRLVIAEFQPPAWPVARKLTGHLLGHAMATNDLADIRELAQQAGWTNLHQESTPVSWLGLIVATEPGEDFRVATGDGRAVSLPD